MNCKKSSHVIIQCKCGSNVCLKCKVPETHKCTFDYRLNAQFQLALNNQKVEAKKVEQI